MSYLLNNMSAPPRSKVEFEQTQLSEYIAFSPIKLCELLKIKEVGNLQSLCDCVKKYVATHPDIEKCIKKPTGYMLAEVIEIESNYEVMLKEYKYEWCLDLDLLILVLSSTVGDLYIPNRPMSYEESRFKHILLFSNKEVNS